MSRHATILGVKGGKWSSLAVGPANEIQQKYKHGSFPGFEKVHYLDTSGGVKHKRTHRDKAPAKKK